MASTNYAGNNYIPSLDGIRALSILVVLLAHSGFGGVVPGGFGVTVFFFLSGYLITSLMLQEHDLTQRIRLRRFFLRRFFRLFPPLLVTLLAAYGLVHAGWLPGKAEINSFAAQIGYFANYYSLFFDGFARIPAGTEVLWSLAVEEHFYILYPVLMCILLRKANMKQLPVALIAICVGVLMWRFVLVVGLDVHTVRTYYATDTRLDSILWGCVLAVWKRPFGAGRDPLPLKPIHYMALAAAAIALAVSFLYRDPVFRETLRYTLQGIALMPLFYLAVTRHQVWLFSWLNLPIMKLLGRYSYAMYLSHFVLINLLWELGLDASQPAKAFVCALLLSTGYGYLIDRYVDPYFLRIRHSLRARQATPFPGTPAA